MLLKRQSGFTLVELLLVTVLLSMFFGIVYGALTGLFQTKKAIEDQRELARSAFYFLNRITEELETATRDVKVDKTKGEDTLVVFRGDNRRDSLADADSISFVSRTGAQAVEGGGGNQGSVQIGYGVANDESDAQGGHVIVRTELPATESDAKLRNLRKITFPVASNVTSLNFRYYRAQRWTDEWPAKANSLPEAIEITVGFKRADGKLESFKTAVALP